MASTKPGGEGSVDHPHSEVAKLLVERSYIHGDFILASGKRSQFYFDCKRTTCFSEAMPLIGRAFLEMFAEDGTTPRSVGGLTSGADPIAQAIAYYSVESGSGPIDMFLVRKEKKEHGAKKWIDGCAEAPIAIVDDVVTSGRSVIKAIRCCRDANLEIVHVAVLVDREEGGIKAIREEVGDVPVRALFTKSELMCGSTLATIMQGGASSSSRRYLRKIEKGAQDPEPTSRYVAKRSANDEAPNWD
jgi:orotate phosphoribosyltransferase